MNIFTKLNEFKNFTMNEKTLAEYILKHPQQVLSMSTQDLAQACFISVSTIYRLCNKCNLSGYAELKLKITRSLDDYTKKDQDFDFNFPVKHSQTHTEIIQNLKEDYELTINSTAKLFDLEMLKKAAFALKNAKHIDIYTSAGNLYFAKNFQFQMQEIGVHVHVFEDEYSQRLQAASSDETHIAMIITFGGRGILSEILLKILQERKTPILLISSIEYQPQIEQPSYHLYICPYENHYKKISSFSTRLSILYILDVLYTSYFELDYDNNVAKKLKYYSIIYKSAQ